MQIKKAKRSTIGLLTLGVLLATSTGSVEAQLVVGIADSTSLELKKKSGWNKNELELDFLVKEDGLSSVLLTGIAGVGQHVAADQHKNSFWVTLRLTNASGKDLQGIDLSLSTPDGPNTTLDGLSFGALSKAKIAELLAKKASGGDIASVKNYWGFGGTFGGNKLTPEYPGEDNALRYHNFFAKALAPIKDGQEVTLRFLITQNGPANVAKLGFDLVPVAVPEPGSTGVALAGLAVAVAAIRTWRRRTPSQ